MADTREYTSRRVSIVTAIAEALEGINGVSPFRTDVTGRVSSRLKFWDEIEDFPAVHVTGGSETRLYQGDNYRDRFLSVTIRAYVNEENAILALEGLLEDIETVLEDNSRLQYRDRDNNVQYTQQISILSIDTDEGVLEPLGVGELACEVRY